MQTKHVSLQEAKNKIVKYCAYQERTQQQVREKLQSYQIAESLVEEIILWLLEENFIDELRYAQTYAKGKAHQLKWGKKKIEWHLKQEGLSAYCIRKGLEAIDQEVYDKNLQKLIKNQLKMVAKQTRQSASLKVKRYLMQKGYTIQEMSPFLPET